MEYHVKYLEASKTGKEDYSSAQSFSAKETCFGIDPDDVFIIQQKSTFALSWTTWNLIKLKGGKPNE